MSQTVVLTGAGGGIGTAIKTALEKAGIGVIATDAPDTDLTSQRDIATLAKSLEGKNADWAIFCHGYIDTETNLENQQAANIETTFAVNTLSIIHLTQQFLARINKGFIFISSTAALSPNGRHAVYSASKAAINAFAQAMAKNRTDRAFITVCPGPTNTPMRTKIAKDADVSQPPQAIAEVIETIVAGNSSYKSGDIVLVKNGRASVHSSL